MSEVPASKAETTAPSTKPQQGKKKPAPQAGDPPGYNPGGESVKITAKMVKRNAVFNEVYVDLDVIANVAATMGSTTYPVHTKVDPGNHEVRVTWNGLCLQMMNVIAFKQFASTLRPDLSYVTDHWGRNVNRRVVVPSGILPLIRSYGTIVDDGGDWEVAGQPVIASTTLLRGIGNPTETLSGVIQPVNRVTSIGFDTGMPNCWSFLVMYARAIVNQYVSGRMLTMSSGAARSQVYSPFIENGFELYFQAFQGSGFPPHVLHAFKYGHIAEATLRMNPIPIESTVPAGIIQALNAEGVVCYFWRRNDLEARFATYYDTVQSRMHPTLDEVFAMSEVTGMNNQGDLSQTVNRKTVENAFVPVKLPGDVLERGTMMCTERSGYAMKEQVYRVDATNSPLEMMANWFDGMRRGKKKAGV